jgi:ribosome-interacting GTPase 1
MLVFFFVFVFVFVCVLFSLTLFVSSYTKPKGQIPDYDAPVVLPRDKNTVEDFCNRIHRGLVDQFKYAWVCGTSVKHNPQKVGLDHELADEDVVQIVKKI